ncbi:MAG TPA: Mov34/MPN/PAD-1 family protein, partial [Chitinophagaceae bacterium]|nr:Mov34/MPN/PAD-1 family protein [Chitinophagaceae bacterium]
MNYSVSISGKMYSLLRDHLFPGDGKEAVAIALCGRHEYKGAAKLTFHKLIPIPHEQCQVRKPDFIQWSTEILAPHLIQASKKGWAVVKIHSHPTGYPDFSQTDDNSDIDLFNSVYGWMDNEESHASLVMLPGGEMFGRIITPALEFVPIDKISLVGH